MTPPEETGKGRNAEPPGASPAVSFCADIPAKPQTLRKRADFLRAASARRQGTGGFLLQARNRDDGSPDIRLGFTASKKIGNAVFRNRAKRRLRAVAQQVLPTRAKPGWDYVLVARPQATVTRAFTDLLDDLATALDSVHRDRAPNPKP
jgi:ribonuclease P protein component